MSLARVLVLALALAASSASCIAGPQPEPPTGRTQDGSPGLPLDDAGNVGGAPDAAAAYDSGAAGPDAGPGIDAGAPGPIVIPPKPVDYPPGPELGPGPMPALIDGSHATVDGGATGP